MQLILQETLQLISSLKCVFKIEMENGANVIAMVMIHVRLRTKIINIAKVTTFWKQKISEPNICNRIVFSIAYGQGGTA